MALLPVLHPGPDRSHIFQAFVVTLSSTEREFVTAYGLFSPSWKDWVPVKDMYQAWARDISRRAARWLEKVVG